MKLKFVILILVQFTSYMVRSQVMQFDENQKLQIKLTNKELNIFNRERLIHLNVTLINRSDFSFLLYGFKYFEEAGTNKYHLDHLSEANYTHDHTIYLQDTNGKYHDIGVLGWARRYIGKPIPIDSADADFENGTVLVPKHDSVVLSIPVRLDKRIKLPKGEYLMFLVYSCGKNIMNVVDGDWLREEQIKSQAILYQGYSKSNVIKLKVR